MSTSRVNPDLLNLSKFLLAEAGVTTRGLSLEKRSGLWGGGQSIRTHSVAPNFRLKGEETQPTWLPRHGPRYCTLGVPSRNTLPLALINRSAQRFRCTNQLAHRQGRSVKKSCCHEESALIMEFLWRGLRRLFTFFPFTEGSCQNGSKEALTCSPSHASWSSQHGDGCPRREERCEYHSDQAVKSRKTQTALPILPTTCKIPK